MNQAVFRSPIVLFVYNRPWHTRQTVEALQENEYAVDSDLFIYSDGAKMPVDVDSVCTVREYIRAIIGFRSVTIVERKENFGLAKSIITGVTEMLERFDSVIVLEDDMVTSPFFLHYMNDALKLYENDERVISVHGYMFPLTVKMPDTFFLKGADCWGWGTWKRGWDLFEADGTKLFKELKAGKLEKRFDFNGTVEYTRMLKDYISGMNDSWAVRWYASALLKDRLTLFPGRSLVQNIGTDSSGIHSGKTNDYRTDIDLKPVHLERLKLEENDYALTVLQNYYNSIRIPFYKQILNNLRVVIGC